MVRLGVSGRMSGAPVPPQVVTWSFPSQAVMLFLRGRTARTAAPVAAVVGTVLSAVNQGDAVLGGGAGTVTWVRVAVNFLVPFCVASIGFLSACRVPEPGAAEPGGTLDGPHDAAVQQRPRDRPG